MLSLPPITLRLRGWKLIDRVALTFLLFCSITLGAAAGLLFVYESDLPEIRQLETYRPNVVTEIYADDGQLVGSFALQRRILMTWEQTPKVLYNAVCAIEDQHFEDHWGVDFPRIAGAAYRNILKHRKAEGASTITMQLAGNLFLDRSERSFRRKAQEMLLALQIERRYGRPLYPGESASMQVWGYPSKSDWALWRTFLIEQRALLDELGELASAASSIQVPVLLIADPADHVVPVKTSRQLAEMLPDARLILVEGAGHHLPRRAPRAVADAIAEFLTEIDDARRGTDADDCEITQAS